MKKVIFFCILIGLYSFSYAQAYQGNGDQKFQAGINAFGYGTGITGSYEYGLNDLLSIGAGADFYWSDDDNFFIYGKANFHLGDIIGIPENMDLYPGVNIGGRNDGFGISGHIGYRYFFTENLGIFGELGSHGALGISFNF